MTDVDERWRAARRVLAVRLDNLGDVLVTTPAIHAIRTSLPDAHLTLLASPVGAQVGRLNPDLDDVIVYEAPWVDPWQRLPQDSAREQRTIAMLRAGRYDGAIIFTSFRQSPLPAAFLCYLADVPLRHAASIDGPGSLLTTRHRHPDRMMHEVERGLDLVGALGLATDQVDLVLRVPDQARRRTDAWLASHAPTRAVETCDDDTPRPPSPNAGGGAGYPLGGGGCRQPLVVLHPGCSMPARTYPWEMFATVVDLLVERLGATVVLTGAADERDLIDTIYDKLSPAARTAAVRRAGHLPFADFCALIETADLVVTNNTGPMHVAAALKTPVVALFALTNPPEQWGPWRVPHRLLNHDVPCRLCYSRTCPYDHHCLRLVTPETVVEAAADLLRQTRDRRRGRPTRLPSSPTTDDGIGHAFSAANGHASAPGQTHRSAPTSATVGARSADASGPVP